MGLIELFAVLGFALAWGVVELYCLHCLRLDKKKAKAKEQDNA